MVAHLHMAAEILEAHGGDVADDFDARRIDGGEKEGGALVGVRVVVVARHDDEEIGDEAIAAEPFVAIEDPIVAVAARGAAQHGGVAAGAGGRLGHREGGELLAVDQRAQVAFALFGVCEALQQVHIALVGGVALDGERAEEGAPGRFEDGDLLDDVEAAAAELRRHGGRPEAGRLGLSADFGEARFAEGGAVLRFVFEGDDLVADERCDARGELLDRFGCTEIHGGASCGDGGSGG